jgi:NAD(P)-dependent dehydrogenase (short-subunit alcohol dehydrogenase family)
MSIPDRPTCVVTGAGSGLGRAFCLQLARRGGRIVVSDVNEASARETAAMLGGAEAHVFRCDVSVRAEVEALAAFADEKLGGADVLVNNAGVAVSGDIGTITDADWQWIVGINLWGPIYGCELFVPGMKQRGRGHIINVASLAGIANAARMAPYNVTKAGVIALSETLHGELAGTGVGVSVLCPSFFPTNIMNASRGGQAREHKMVAKMMAKSPVTADDVARIALDAAARGELHVLPHAEGRWLWRMRRLAPQGSLGMSVSLRKLLERRFASSR